MKILTVMISLGLLVFLGHEAVALHKRTVCRQEAWRSSLTLHTRTLLTKHESTEGVPLPSCRILVSRNRNEVSWRRFPVPRKHPVPLKLQGQL